MMKRWNSVATFFLCVILCAACANPAVRKSRTETSAQTAAESSKTAESTEDTGENSPREETTGAKEDEKAAKELAETQEIGDDSYGYLSIPLGFVPFNDVDHQEAENIQYSDLSGTNIITLDTFDGQQLPESFDERSGALLMTKMILVSYQGKYEVVEQKESTINDFRAFTVTTDYDDNTRTVVTVLGKDGHYYYVCVEGRRDFTDTSDAILASFHTA